MKKHLILTCLLLLSLLSVEGCTVKENTYSEELYQAIDSGDEEQVRVLLEQKGDVNTPRRSDSVLNSIDFENVYPLEKACKTSANMVKLLLDAGADVDIKDTYLSSTPLIYALSSNYEERFSIAMELINKGADINHVDRNGRTALNKAAIIFSTDGEEARQDEKKLMEYLLENCDLNSVIEESGSNPLLEAASYNNTEVISLILDNDYLDIDIQSKGYTPLMKAVMTENVDACRLLLDSGANRDIESPKGKTAYDYAIEKGNQEIIDCFN